MLAGYTVSADKLASVVMALVGAFSAFVEGHVTSDVMANRGQATADDAPATGDGPAGTTCPERSGT
jgi:hypothetical protein